MNQATSQFQVVLTGAIQAGQDRQLVLDKLAKLFKQPPEMLASLLNGKVTTIKRGLSETQAMQYVTALNLAGAIARAEAMMTASTPAAEPLQASVNKTKQPLPKKPSKPIDDILTAFTGKIDPVPTTPMYHLSMLLGTVIMLLMPFLYVALICGVIFGLYFHATESIVIFKKTRGYAALLIYLTPLAVGGALTLFMLRPLLINWRHHDPDKDLDPNTQPHLYAFVNKICDLVGARRPSMIRLNSEVNASASFRHGATGMFTRQMVLTLGMPLIGCLDTRTLAGILAHEFGHFRQGANMRMTFLNYKVLNWFNAAIHMRGSLDQKLEEWASSSHQIIAIPMQVSRAFIWLTRKILLALSYISARVYYLLCRQGEFDADRYAARLIGSQNFRSISQEVIRLSMAANAVNEEMNTTWYNNQQLVDDYTRAIAAEYQNQPADIQQTVDKIIAEGNTHWQNTHPCDRERNENALREKTEGVFTLTLPASQLFTRFDKFSKEMTFHHYRNVWELPVATNNLVPIEQFLGQRKQREQRSAAMDYFFKECFNIHTPVLIMPVPKVNSEQQAKFTQQWHSLAEQLNKNQSLIKQHYDQCGQLYERKQLAENAEALLKAGFTIDPKEFKLTKGDLPTVASRLARLNEEYGPALQQMQNNNKLIYNRLQIDFALAQLPSHQAATAAFRDNLPQLQKVTDCLIRLNGVMDEVRQLGFVLGRLSTLLHNYDSDETQNPKDLRSEIEGLAEICRRHLTALQNSLANLAYPFAHTKTNYQLGDHIFTQNLSELNPPQMAQYGDTVQNDLYYFKWQCVAALADHARQIESALGLAS